MKAFLLLSLAVLSLSYTAHADLVRLTHYPAILKKVYGLTTPAGKNYEVSFSDWKLTNLIENNSPYASGFVVAVKEGLTSDVQDYADFMSYVYPNGQKFKAVYIITNHHVWYNDRDDLQDFATKNSPEDSNYSGMVATPLSIYNKNGEEIFNNTYFPNTSPINSWDFQNYRFDLESMGVRQIKTCYSPKANRNSFEGLALNWGCDFTLIRILVPDYVKVRPEIVSKNGLRKNDELDIWFSGHKHGNYKVDRMFGDKDEAIVADISNYSYVIVPGWSGSPVLDKRDGSVTALTSSGWPGASTKAGLYNIEYVMRNLRVENEINNDIQILKRWLKTSKPTKGNFYGPWIDGFP